MENNRNVVASFSLETIGIIVGIVLSILQGTKVINIGWFWATFPFWICIAVDVAILIIVGIVLGIVALHEHHNK